MLIFHKFFGLSRIGINLPKIFIMKNLEKRIFKIDSEQEFNSIAIEIFRLQAKFNPIYKKFIEYLKIKPDQIYSIEQIPFLPIEFFKTYKIITQYYEKPIGDFTIFKSSGTTGMNRSTHYIYNISLYKKSLLSGFVEYFGEPKNYTILALLPSYIEAGNSSLVYMVNELIKKTEKKDSGFYLYDHKKLAYKLKNLNEKAEKTILFGVSYALLDFAQFIEKEEFNNLTIIETGGMKGRKKEITREELHQEIAKSFVGAKIYSEYGMTEMLSQAYSKEDGIFIPTKTMKVMIRDIYDPLSYVEDRKTGGINVIDLANLYSCSFISTKDLGRKNNKGFEVLGRFDNSDIRGCNLMII